MAVLALVARFALLWQLPLPQCWLRRLTDIPCPSCGCTRSLAAWATLDVGLAFRLNPLFFLICLALLSWAVLRMVERFTRKSWLNGFKLHVGSWRWWPIGLTLVALNWLYLCLTLPK